MAKKQINKTSGKYVFRKHASIGANDAIEDRDFLKECFVNTGELDILLDTNDHHSIILGRTGAGKTALIEMLKLRAERVTLLEPESLALTYLSNSSSLSFYSEVGLKIDVFYQMLWRHIFAIEIIKMFFDTTNSSKTESFLQNIKLKLFKKKSSENARDYLVKWGESFWKETDYQITEYTKKLETGLTDAVKAGLSTSFPKVFEGNMNVDRTVVEKLTEEEKAEIIKLAQPVVDQVQMKEMTDVINLLEEELLVDRQKKCYIAIDRLDERWVHDNLRYRLIRALFEAARYINNKLPTVKVVIAIREDLLGRVFRFARDVGDQEEKYKSLYLHLRWQPQELESVIDFRVDKLMRDQYTQAIVRAKDILPKTVMKQQSTLNYIVERTLHTPRDIIMFFNECLKMAAGKTKLTQQMILAAETEYSQARLKALGDEWSGDYVDLVSLIITFLKKMPESFYIREIETEGFQQKMLEFLSKPRDTSTYTYIWVNGLAYERDKPRELLFELIKVLHQIGVIGVKTDSYREIYWSYIQNHVTESELDEDTRCYVHPAFHRVLGIRFKK